jgi:hypothetical protein
MQFLMQTYRLQEKLLKQKKLYLQIEIQIQ